MVEDQLRFLFSRAEERQKCPSGALEEAKQMSNDRMVEKTERRPRRGGWGWGGGLMDESNGLVEREKRARRRRRGSLTSKKNVREDGQKKGAVGGSD